MSDRIFRIPLVLLFACIILAQSGRSQDRGAPLELHVIAPQSSEELRHLFRFNGQPAHFVSAHRGGARPGYPENCIATFEDTLRSTFAILEIDPRYTKDRQIIVHHDAELDRTTNGQGKVAEQTLEQLQKLRLKDPAGNLTQYPIPTLREVLQWARGKTVLVLDQKDVPVAARVQAITAEHAESFAMLIVYSFEDAQTCYRLNPNIMMEVMIPGLDKLHQFDQLGVPWSNIVAFVGHQPSHDEQLLDAIHHKGQRCMAGTSRNLDKELVRAARPVGEAFASRYQTLLRKGIDIVETDMPREVGRLLYGNSPIPEDKAEILQVR